MVIPYISRDDVATALNALVHAARRAETTGLQHLMLVDLRLTMPDMPVGDDSRAFVLRELLTAEIAAGLSESRRVFGLTPPDDHAPRAEALASLVGDSAQGSHELIAWSVVYYRCVRPDLALSVETLAEQIGVTPRTITRYYDEGIDLLTGRLIRLEQQSRRQHLERRLYAVLPYSVPVLLAGREELLRRTASALPALSPQHLLITGSTGIGKTTFVQEFLRRQIVAGNLDQLIWLDHPASVAFIREHINETLLRDDARLSLRDYLLLYRVAVVLDEIETAAGDTEAFSQLLRDLGAALVCLISHADLALDGVVARLPLPEIGRTDAEAVVETALRLHPNIGADDPRIIAEFVYERVGGNPLALWLAAAQYEYSDDWQSLETSIHERLLDRTLATLDTEELRAWIALALFDRSAHFDELSALWGIRPQALAALVRLGLATGSAAETFALAGGARDFIRRQYHASLDVRAGFDTLLAEISGTDAALDVIEQVLLGGAPELDPQARAVWIGRFWVAGLHRGHWARWRTILEAHLRDADSDQPELRIAYGICLRHLADWQGAQQVFRSASAQFGRAGRFAEQARVMAEWGILARNQGEFETALELIGQSRRYAERVRDADLLRMLALQEAHILIQQGRAGDAPARLAIVPETPQTLALHCEALLALRDYDACRSLAQRALRQLSGDLATEASLYTIIGRSYQHQGDHDRAHAFLTEAVTLLERSDDAFALARAQTNLAAVLIPMRRFPDAGLLLQRAEEVQARLGDQVGLGATRHNRQILGGYIAR